MTDHCAFEPKGLIGVEEALQLIDSRLQPLESSIRIPLGEATGRILSQDVISPIDLPFDRNSAMDGYAYSAKDAGDKPLKLKIMGTAWAGKPFEAALKPECCVRIFTGAVVPDGADSVVMQEDVEREGDYVVVPVGQVDYRNIREAGEEILRGEMLCAAGKKLSPADIGLMAAAGIANVFVRPRLSVGFFSTGDELIPLGQPLVPGKIYDSNAYVLPGLLTNPAVVQVNFGVLPDLKDLLKERIKQAAERCDVLISTGGASVGEADYIKDVLGEIGEIGLWKIAIKPGKPMIFGKIGRCYYFGLPGNPVSMMVTFHQIVAPALNRLSGAVPNKPLKLRAICTTALKKSTGRQDYQRGILTQDDSGQFYVASTGPQGSHLLSSMSRSNCFIVLPPECDGIQCGETVTVEPFGVNL